MGEIARWGPKSLHRARHQRRGAGNPLSGLARLGALVLTAAAVVLGTVLTLVFAATLALVMVLATALLGLAALAWRIRHPASRGVLIEARRLGHSWVAYGWDQRAR